MPTDLEWLAHAAGRRHSILVHWRGVRAALDGQVLNGPDVTAARIRALIRLGWIESRARAHNVETFQLTPDGIEALREC